MKQIKIYWRGEISASHQLPWHKGKCRNLHGHNYFIEVWIKTTADLPQDGIILDYGEIKEVVKAYDHKHLNDLIENPTAERLAEEIAEKIIKRLGKRVGPVEEYEVKVRVWEDKDSYAEVEIVEWL